jgi:hypothetical protein
MFVNLLYVHRDRKVYRKSVTKSVRSVTTAQAIHLPSFRDVLHVNIDVTKDGSSQPITLSQFARKDLVVCPGCVFRRYYCTARE